MEDLWTVVRRAAEGTDWKRDEGESLTAWAQRTLLAKSAGPAERSIPPVITLELVPDRVLDELRNDGAEGFVRGWNACRTWTTSDKWISE